MQQHIVHNINDEGFKGISSWFLLLLLPFQMSCFSRAMLRAARSLWARTRQNGRPMDLAAVSSSRPSPVN